MAYPSGPSGPSGAPGPSGSRGYYPGQRPSDYAAYQRPASAKPGTPPLPRYLALAVVALGLLSYLFSYFFEVHGDLGWPVRFALLAGLLAAFDLAPKQTPAAKVVAALATIGFLDALSAQLTAPDTLHQGWALAVVVVVNGLQALAAIGALLMGSGAVTERSRTPARDPYADPYSQAGSYYGRYAQQRPGPDTLQRRGAATGQAQQRAAATEQTSRYGDYADFVGERGGERTGERTAVIGRVGAAPEGAPPAPPGLPNVGQAPAPQGPQRGGTGEHRLPPLPPTAQ